MGVDAGAVPAPGVRIPAWCHWWAACSSMRRWRQAVSP